MRKEEFSEVLGDINETYVQEARAYNKRKKPARMKWVAMAACLCLVVIGAMYTLAPDTNDKPVLEWSESFSGTDYFKYNDSASGSAASNSLDSSAMPYAAERYFSDDRDQMEADGVIPAMADYPLYDCVARYHEDGSIYSVTFTWRQRGDHYSDLSITAGYQEVQMVRDCITVEVDEDGNILSPSVTVTERDGVQIVAGGSENRDKTLTFQNDTGWYQIEGSWRDSYESVAALLDWVWTHPVNFDLFAKDLGAEITSSTLENMPEAFSDYIPDFEALGYRLGENDISLKDGTPYRFEGHYYSSADESTEIHWCVDAEPDYYDRQESLGDISQLTEELITDTLSESSSFSFMIDNCFIKVYTKEAHESWLLAESLTSE